MHTREARAECSQYDMITPWSPKPIGNWESDKFNNDISVPGYFYNFN